MGGGDPLVKQRRGLAGVNGLLRDGVGGFEPVSQACVARHQMTVGDDCGSGVQQRGGTERHILACEEVSCQLRVERRFATLQICDGDFGEAEFDGRIEFVFGNLAVLEFPNGDRTGRCHLVKASWEV